MNENPDARTLAAVLAEEARAGDAHPELDELVDYHAGRLAPADEERVRDHLVGCRACTRALLELEPLASPEPEGEAVDLEMRASLRELERRVAAAPPAATAPRLVYAAAAACLAAAVALAIWVADLRRELDRPRINLAIEYLEAEGRRGPAGAFELPVGHDSWILGLFPEDPRRRLPEYEVVLVDGDGRELWRARGLVMDDDAGVVTLSIPRRWIAPGAEYRLELHGAGDRRAPEGTYRLRGPPG